MSSGYGRPANSGPFIEKIPGGFRGCWACGAWEWLGGSRLRCREPSAKAVEAAQRPHMVREDSGRAPRWCLGTGPARIRPGPPTNSCLSTSPPLSEELASVRRAVVGSLPAEWSDGERSAGPYWPAFGCMRRLERGQLGTARPRIGPGPRRGAPACSHAPCCLRPMGLRELLRHSNGPVLVSARSPSVGRGITRGERDRFR